MEQAMELASSYVRSQLSYVRIPVECSVQDTG